MSTELHDLQPLYGEAAYLDDDELELVGRTKGHRLAVLSDDELPDLVVALRERCEGLDSRIVTPAADPDDTKDTLMRKFEILSAAMKRAASEAERRNQRLAAADLNAFTEDVLDADLDGAAHRRGSAARFARTIGSPHASEGKARTSSPRQ